MQRSLSSYDAFGGPGAMARTTAAAGGGLTAVPPALRRARILERIQRDGGVSVAELARAYAVSPITVHRDLERLAGEGLVERVHGGARAVAGDGSPPIATAWAQRAAQAGAAKAAMAAHAQRFVDH